MAEYRVFAPLKALFQKDADFGDRWGRRAFKYIAWALIGAAAMAVLFYASPVALPALAIFGAFKLAAVIGVGLMAGLGTGMFATGLRETLARKETNYTVLKTTFGLILASPLLFVGGLFLGLTLTATATWMIVAPALAGITGAVLPLVLRGLGLGKSANQDHEGEAEKTEPQEAIPTAAPDKQAPPVEKRYEANHTQRNKAFFKNSIEDGNYALVAEHIRKKTVNVAELDKESALIPLAIRWEIQGKSDGNRARIIRLLQAHGADINRADNKGNTALHYAAMIKRTLSAGTLLSLGANRTLKNQDGKTADDLDTGNVLQVTTIAGDDPAHPSRANNPMEASGEGLREDGFLGSHERNPPLTPEDDDEKGTGLDANK